MVGNHGKWFGPNFTGAFAGNFKVSETLRVMIVDDSPIVRVMVKKVLAYDPRIKVVANAANGKEALEKLDSGEHEIDLILLDLTMPVMSGIEFLKQTQGKLETPVVVLTAAESEMGTARSLGARAAIGKPTSGLQGSPMGAAPHLIRVVWMVGGLHPP